LLKSQGFANDIIGYFDSSIFAIVVRHGEFIRRRIGDQKSLVRLVMFAADSRPQVLQPSAKKTQPTGSGVRCRMVTFSA